MSETTEAAIAAAAPALRDLVAQACAHIALMSGADPDDAVAGLLWDWRYRALAILAELGEPPPLLKPADPIDDGHDGSEQ